MKTSFKWAICEYIYNINSKGNTGHYCYCSKSDIQYEENYQDYKEHKYVNKHFQSILSDIQDYYIKTCKLLEKSGYSILEYRMSFDEMKDHCNANDYTFFENGNMFNL